MASVHPINASDSTTTIEFSKQYPRITGSLRELAVLPPEPHTCHQLIGLHNAFRRDFWAMEDKALSLTLSTFTVDIATEFELWYKRVDINLTHHHHYEDSYWFPEFEKRVPKDKFASMFQRLESEHKQIHAIQFDLEDGLKVLKINNNSDSDRINAINQVVTSIQKLGDILHHHFVIEEEFWSLELGKTVSIEEQIAIGNEFGAKHMKPEEIGDVFGYMCVTQPKNEMIDCIAMMPDFIQKDLVENQFPKFIQKAPLFYKQAHGLL